MPVCLKLLEQLKPVYVVYIYIYLKRKFSVNISLYSGSAIFFLAEKQFFVLMLVIIVGCWKKKLF